MPPDIKTDDFSVANVKNSDTPALCDLSIIIVSYNVRDLLEKCLLTIIQPAGSDLKIEIIVVDNASQDGSAAMVASNYPVVQLIANKYNYGFPRACNQGLHRSTGRYLFFLNPDTELEKGGLEALVRFMEDRPVIGVIGPKLFYPDGNRQSSRRRFPGLALALVESTILERITFLKDLPALRSFSFQDEPDDIAHEVDWLVGAALLVRRAVVADIGGFDERYFMYSEELDFCRRAKMAGWQVWYAPVTTITHFEGQSSRQDLAARHINFHSSKLSYFRKFHGRLYAVILRLFLLLSYLFQFAEEALKLRLGHKVELRRDRLQLIRQVLANGLVPYRPTLPQSTAELNLCLISAEYFPQPGGVGDYTDCLAANLRQAGAGRVEILTGRSGFIDPEPDLIKRAVSGWNWRSLPEVARYLKLRPVHSLNIQYQTGAYRMHPAINFLPLYLKIRFGRQKPLIVVTFHDLLTPYLFPKAGPLRIKINQLLMRTGDYAVVTNQADYHKALAWGLSPSRVKLIPIGSNIRPVSSFQEEALRQLTRNEIGLKETDFAVGYFGLANPGKGLDTFIQAIRQLNEAGSGWKAVIVGGLAGDTDPGNRAFALQLDQQIDQLSSQPATEGLVIRTGHLAADQASRLLYALDAVALPFKDGASFRRGSLLAALAHALPVVTTWPSGGQDPTGPQLVDGQNILMVKPEEPEALAATLIRLKADPALRKIVSQGGLELSRNFSWENIAAAYLEIFSAPELA